MDDEVLADSSSEQERRRRVGGVRGRGRGSPAAGRHKKQHTEDLEIVKRDSQGNYLLGGSELMGNAKALVQVQDLVDEEEKALEEVDAYYEALAKRYFSSGAEVTTRRVEEGMFMFSVYGWVGREADGLQTMNAIDRTSCITLRSR